MGIKKGTKKVFMIAICMVTALGLITAGGIDIITITIEVLGLEGE